MGIFWIFQKEDRKFVTFKTGLLGGPATKVKLHGGSQLGFPHAD